MIIVVTLYTVETVTLNLVGTSESNLLPPGYLDTHSFSGSEVSAREYGSKLVLVVEQCQCAVIWLCKAGLAIMYLRITSGLPHQHIWVKMLAVYVVLTYIIMEILYLGVWCRPFHDYWAVPTPNVQCSAATNHLITNFVFNLTSDIALLLIGVPLFITSKLPLKRKLILTGVFCLGLFNMTCAVLNKYYSFTQPFGNDWTFWYMREAATAILVANLPFMWTLLRRVCGLKTWVANATINSDPRQRLTSLHMMQQRPSLAWKNTACTTRATASVATDDDHENHTRKGWAGGSTLQSRLAHDDEKTVIGSPSVGPEAHNIFKTVEVSVTNTTLGCDGEDDEYESLAPSTHRTSPVMRPASIRAMRMGAHNLALPQHALTTTSGSEALAAKPSSWTPPNGEHCSRGVAPAVSMYWKEPDDVGPAGRENVSKARKGSWARWWAP